MSKKYPTETTKLLQEAFPKFSKICLSMANNPEYGVDISPDAKLWLNRMNLWQGMNATGLSAEEQEIVQKYVEEHFPEIVEYITWRALNKRYEKPMHERLPGQEDAL